MGRGKVATSSGHFPDPQLEALQGLGRYLSLGFTARGKTETLKLAQPRAGYRTLTLVHFELELLCQKPGYSRHHPLTRLLVVHIHNASSSAGESHPSALTEPFVNRPAHTASLIQSPAALSVASGRINLGHARQCVPTNGLPSSGGPAIVCVPPPVFWTQGFRQPWVVKPGLAIGPWPAWGF
jgi:hypothetical protein